MSANVIVQVKECDVCRMAIRIISDEGRETAFDVASGDVHDCFDVPEDADLLVMDDDCNCGHS